MLFVHVRQAPWCRRGEDGRDTTVATSMLDTRPGLTPAIRAGKGWRGHRELAPRCSATQFGACMCGHIDKDMSVTHRSEPQPPQPSPPPAAACLTGLLLMARREARRPPLPPPPPPPLEGSTRLTRVLNFFCAPSPVDMSPHVDGACGAAMRRRLRAQLRHEQQSVAMALAATHHSAPRRPKTARVGVRPGVLEARTETEHELYAAKRRPKPPSPGVPSMAFPLLVGQATEGMDSATLQFLTASALRRTKEEEEEEEAGVG